MSNIQLPALKPKRTPWNKGRLIGQKRPLLAKQVWAIRARLELAGKLRDLALFNLAIDSKLRGCDLVRLKVTDLVVGDRVRERVTVVQSKTQRPVQFEVSEPPPAIPARPIVDLPLDFRARVSVTDVVERIQPPARNAGLWSVRGARLPRDQEETWMTDQTTENLPSDPAKHKAARPVTKPKTEMLRKLLERRTGATVVQIQKQLGWQSHTIRAAISRLRSSGVPVELDRSGRVARYRIMLGEDQ